MKPNRSPKLLLLMSLATFGAFVQKATADDVAYDVENTGAHHPAPTFPAFDYLPIVRPLPDAFRSFDGTRDTSLDGWERRRNEIKASVEKYEIGMKPDASDLVVTARWKPPGQPAVPGGPNIAAGQLITTVTRPSNGKTLTLTSKVWTPNPATWGPGPFPALITMSGSSSTSNTASYGGLNTLNTRPIATIEFSHNNVTQYGGSSDKRLNPFYQMYPELLPAGTPTTPEQLAENPNATWGSNSGQYAAWAWGVSRVIDGLYLVSQELGNAFPVDPNYLAVTGCSYGGKMALFAGAFDERIALTIPLESGGGGAPAWRVGQEIEGTQVAETAIRTDRQWFASQLWRFAGNTGFDIYKLPHDHHELMGMVAPRALLETGNMGYNWLSNRANYVSAKATQKIYETLGIGDRFGFIIDGQTGATHGHCSVPASQNPHILNFVDKFLLGVSEAVTNDTHVHPFGSTIDHERWTEWWGTDTPSFPRDFNTGYGVAVLSQTRQVAVPTGRTVLAGYAVSLPGAHAATTITVAGSHVQLDVVAPDGRSRIQLVPLPNRTYTSLENDASWLPASSPRSSLTFQGSVVSTGFAGVAQKAYFSALGVQATAGAGNPAGPGVASPGNAPASPKYPVDVKFHVDVGPSVVGGPWSATTTVVR